MNRLPPFLLLVTLCTIGLSSCVYTVHRYVWNRAKIVDEVFWVENPENVQLFRVGNIYYAKGYLGPARGGQTTHDVPGFVLGMHGGSGLCFYPIRDKGKPVYFRLYELEKESVTKRIAKARAEGKKLYFGSYCPGEHSYITELPKNARSVDIVGAYISYPPGRQDAAAPPRIDAHAWYAYPAGAVLAVGIDAPLTIAGNALLAGAAVASLPVAGVVALYQWAAKDDSEPTNSSPTSDT